MARRSALGGAAGTLLVQAALLGAIAWGLAAGGGALSMAAVVAVFLLAAVAEPMGALPRAGAGLAAAAAAARRLFEAADTPAPVPEPPEAAATDTPAGHAIRFEGVHFAWAADRAPVFAGLDLEVSEGARLLVLGASGSGKSSLAALLLKLAAPDAGRVTLGGVDIASLPAEAVRRRIACLTQDARLFDDSIAANLRIAAPGAPDAALWRALDRAGIGELVRALPDGLAYGLRGRRRALLRRTGAALGPGEGAALGGAGPGAGRTDRGSRRRGRARLSRNPGGSDRWPHGYAARPPGDRRGTTDPRATSGRRPRSCSGRIAPRHISVPRAAEMV